MKLAFLKRFHRLFTVNAVIPTVPYHHCAAAVLSLWNNAFELLIFDWMIFHFYCQVFLTSLPREPFR